VYRNISNAVLFQAAWFAAVLGAGKGMPWLGTVVLIPVLSINLYLSDKPRSELLLIISAGVLGFVFDTALVAGGFFTPVHYLLPPPLSPVWMIGLWMNFAASLNVSLGWLRGKYLVASLFGAVGGPLAYYGGGKLGATLALPDTQSIIVLAVGWSVMTPLLYWLAAYFRSSEKSAVSE
jgi:hypothetical protein